jgi:hypothetical protein
MRHVNQLDTVPFVQPRQSSKDKRKRAQWRDNRTTVLRMIECGGRVRLQGVYDLLRERPLS